MSVTVDTAPWNAMCRDLSRLTGAPFESVVDYEAARSLEAALRYTPVASVAKIRANVDAQKVVTYDLGNGLQRYYLSNRYPAPLWGQIQQRRAEGLKRKLRARGLSKQAFAKLAQSAGLVIRKPAFVSKAVPSTGRTYDNETVHRQRSLGRYGLFVASSMPTLGTARVAGQRRLQRALDGRVKFFRRNVSLRVFDRASTIAKKYPGVIVR